MLAGLPTCTEACEQLGPLGPALVLGLVALLNWLRARQAQKRAEELGRESMAAQLEAAKHAAHNEQLRAEVASLRPKSNPELMPVVIPPTRPPPADLLAEVSPPELERQKEK